MTALVLWKVFVLWVVIGMARWTMILIGLWFRGKEPPPVEVTTLMAALCGPWALFTFLVALVLKRFSHGTF